MSNTKTVISHSLIVSVLQDLGLEPSSDSPKWGLKWAIGRFGMLARAGKEGCPLFHLQVEVPGYESDVPVGELPGRIVSAIKASRFESKEQVEEFLTAAACALIEHERNTPVKETRTASASKVRILG